MKSVEGAYIAVLREELVPAQGCTEPIALAYCAAVARETLGRMPERLRVQASGNIIKNVKGVIVPGTGGRKGIEAAAVFGAVAGNAKKKLEVLSEISEEDGRAAAEFLARPGSCTVEHLATDAKLHIIVEAYAGEDRALAEIRDRHTALIRVERNEEVRYCGGAEESGPQEPQTDRSFMSVDGIVSFAETVELSKIDEVISRQIAYNWKISQEGLANPYGACIGRTLLEHSKADAWTQAKAAAAAGSDARMSGSVLPVVINSGSGNQGITVTLPVVVYARHIGADRERLIRAVAISNLVAIHQKTKVGRLSAYCGAVNAAAGSGAAIAWLDGASREVIALTISNTLANVSGIICDGAKPSCAAKIASSVEAGILGYHMYLNGQQFRSGDGIITKGVEATIRNVSRLGREGMRETDKEIVRIMMN